MRETAIGSTVQLEFFPSIFPVSCYLVADGDGLILVDTALAGGARSVAEAAQRTALPVTRILLTHAHGDHVGGLDALHARYPDAAVGISRRDGRLLAGDRALEDGERGPIKGQLVACKTRPTIALRAGERVGPLEVVPSPGHTPGHLAFLDTREGTLIAGDAFQTHGGVAVSGVIRPLFPFPAMATWDREAALESARALRAMKPARLAVGHGRVLQDPLPAMDRAITEAERRLARGA